MWSVKCQNSSVPPDLQTMPIVFMIDSGSYILQFPLMVSVIRGSLPALIVSLEEVKSTFYNGRAEDISQSIFNVKFALTLSLLCDVYLVFGHISEGLQVRDLYYYIALNESLFQKVSTLPHMRYDNFLSQVKKLETMSLNADMKDCPCSPHRLSSNKESTYTQAQKMEALNQCKWPKLHGDIASLKETGKIHHIIQGQLVADPVRDTRIGKSKRSAQKLLNEENIISTIVTRAEKLSGHIASKLKVKVYRKEDLQVIQNCRILLGATDLMTSISVQGDQGGHATVSNLTWKRFKESAINVDPSITERIKVEDFKGEYRRYCRRLEMISRDSSSHKLSDMEVFERFLKEEALYEGLETVFSVMVKAGLLISVESVVESWISVMEHHASQRRRLGEAMIHEQMVIAINGPELEHYDSILKVFF